MTAVQQETGHLTGTKDKDYNLVWYIEACLSNALRMETYRQDAERDNDTELAELFTKAQADSRKGAQLGKQLLASRLGGAAPAGAAPGGGTEGVGGSRTQPPTDVMAPNQGATQQTDAMAPNQGTQGTAQPTDDAMAPLQGTPEPNETQDPM